MKGLTQSVVDLKIRVRRLLLKKTLLVRRITISFPNRRRPPRAEDGLQTSCRKNTPLEYLNVAFVIEKKSEVLQKEYFRADVPCF